MRTTVSLVGIKAAEFSVVQARQLQLSQGDGCSYELVADVSRFRADRRGALAGRQCLPVVARTIVAQA